MTGTTTLSTEELARLKSLGDVLIPPSGSMPAFSAVADIDRLLEMATAVCGKQALKAALSAQPTIGDLAGARAFAEASRVEFDLVALVVSGAYYMAPEVLVALDYPLERRNAAGVSDFADEYMTGIVDPVVENRRGAVPIA